MYKYVHKVLDLHRRKILKPNTDKRVANGPIDVRKVYHATKVEFEFKGRGFFSRNCNMESTGRGYFFGDLRDPAIFQESQHGKAFRSLPFCSWSGGHRLSECDSSTKKRKGIVNQLSRRNDTVGRELQPFFPNLVAAAEILWKEFQAAFPKEAATMQQYLQRFDDPPRIGCTAWTSWTINIDYRTANHVDGKNVDGSFSALVILPSYNWGGRNIYGGFYCLPQYGIAIDMLKESNQVKVIFHRSGDRDVGMHGNSAIRYRDGAFMRVAIVFYQTKLAGGAHREEEDHYATDAEPAPPSVHEALKVLSHRVTTKTGDNSECHAAAHELRECDVCMRVRFID